MLPVTLRMGQPANANPRPSVKITGESVEKGGGSVRGCLDMSAAAQKTTSLINAEKG